MPIHRVLRFTAFLLIPAILSNNLAFAAKKQLDSTAVKAKIQSEGVGQGVQITRVDKTEVQGVIASIGEQSFVLVLKAKGKSEPTTIDYAQVTAIRRRHKLTTGQWVAIGVLGAGALYGIGYLVTYIGFASK
jgi:hypothetical protein